MSSPPYNVRNYGATGLRQGNSTKAFHDAIVACTTAGGGTVLVPAGDHTVSTGYNADAKDIELKNNRVRKAKNSVAAKTPR